MIANVLENRRLPVYGDGLQVRDWLYVDGHCRGILAVLDQAREGQIYNIGGNRSLPNIEVVKKVLALTQRPESLIEYVTDRPGPHYRLVPGQPRLGSLASAVAPIGSTATATTPTAARPTLRSSPRRASA